MDCSKIHIKPSGDPQKEIWYPSMGIGDRF